MNQSGSGLPKIYQCLVSNSKAKSETSVTLLFPDNLLLAGVDDDSVYLWDVSTRTIRGLASSKELARIIELFFLADHCTLVSRHKDQSMYIWDAVDRSLYPRPIDTSSPSDVTINSSLLLDVNEDGVHDIAGAR